MNKFIGGEEKAVNIGDPVIFENNTDSNYEVSAGIVFHTSGIYEVSIVGNRTIVSKVERKPSNGYNRGRRFVQLLVEYPDPEICTYKEYKGKPYFSIKYIENGEEYVGFGTYNPKVLSQYLKEYFMINVQPEEVSDADRILKILESAKDKNGDVPMSLVRKAFDKLLPSKEKG